MNWNYLKLFSREELEQMVPSGFDFKRQPWDHQLATFLANISNDGFLDSLDLGTGKTKIAIDVVRHYDWVNNKKNKTKALFVCLSSAMGQMAEEVVLNSNMRAILIDPPKANRWKLIKRRANFYIINYEGLRSMVTKRVPKGRKLVNGKEKIIKKEVIDEAAIRMLVELGFDILILDESHKIKSANSVTFRIIRKICRSFQKRILMTGTPFGNTPLDLWTQYYTIDFGETFGRSISIFRNAYFKDVGFFGPVWVPTKDGEKYIKSRMYEKAIRYREDEVGDLPAAVDRNKPYKLSAEQRRVYNELLDDKYTDITKDIASKGIAYRTIASGFIKSSGYIFKKNPKLDLLWDIIESAIDNHKIVVFVEYTLSRKIIEKMLKKKKVKFASLSGETGGRLKKEAQIKMFKEDDDCRVFLAQIQSGGASLNLQVATYCIFYEHKGSVIDYKQAKKRIHRGGQTRRCFFYSLIGERTVEVGINKDLLDGVDAFSRIVDNKTAIEYMKGEDVNKK